MKCRKCCTEYEGDFCPSCGKKATKEKKLLGFRSNKVWKKIISIIYMIFVAIYILGSFTSIKSVPDLVGSVQGLMYMLAPYIFLSNFKLREFLPLFKKRRAGLSILGMILVYIIITILFNAINPASRCDHEWKETENIKATCYENGYITSHCDLCNDDMTKLVEKTVHNWVETETKPAACLEDGFKKSQCDICGDESTEILEKTGHKWTEIENKAANCLEEGYIKSHCDLCNEDKTEVVEKTQHIWYETEKVLPNCAKEGYIKFHCDLCNQDKTETTEKVEHTWEGATCESSSICSVCNEIKGDALGHTTKLGVCSRCNKEVRKISPVTILDWTYKIDSVGGVQWNYRIKNNTDKQIKYVTMKWECYNAVGDRIYDRITGKNYVRIKHTGPINAYSTTGHFKTTDKFYNYNLTRYVMTEVTVEYMNGTFESVGKYHDGLLG